MRAVPTHTKIDKQNALFARSRAQSRYRRSHCTGTTYAKYHEKWNEKGGGGGKEEAGRVQSTDYGADSPNNSAQYTV